MTHPTRKILEQGGVVDGEAFKIMLEEESQNEILEILKEINTERLSEPIQMRARITKEATGTERASTMGGSSISLIRGQA